MLDQYFRDSKDAWLAGLAWPAPAISPHVVTGLGLFCGLLAALLAFAGETPWALVFWWLNRLADGLDGALARHQGRASDLGGYVDIMADFTVYALLPVALVLGRPSPAHFAGLAVLLAVFYLNAASWLYLAAVLEKRRARRTGDARRATTTIIMPGGLVAGTETVLFYTLFILLPERFPLLALLMAGLLVVTIGQRLRWAARALRV